MSLAADHPRPCLSLVERLSGRADRLRGLEVRLGARPWRVFVRLFRWTGGERFHGQRELAQELELTPPPIVRGESSLRYQVTAGGTRSEGVLRLEEVSPRYTERDLDILRAPLGDTEEIRIDIVHDARDGAEPEVRSYRPAGRPERDVTGLQWTIALEQLAQRGEGGTP